MRTALSVLMSLSLSYNVLSTLAFYGKDQELKALKKKYRKLRAWAEISVRIMDDQDDVELSPETAAYIKAYQIFDDNNML
jgi:hypothetical protein